jgi:RHS repeat-associated protein
VWLGSLIEDKQDAAGTHYRLNRYYDPESGRFTQEDPIGLAGGLNLYGFANGDPVNFSDPFGLCPPENDDYSDCTAGQRLRLFGRNFLAGLGAMPGDPDTGPGWLAGARVGVLLGGLGKGVGLAARDASGVARVARGLGDIGGGAATAEEALTAATKWLGEGYREVAPGVFRSADNARQFRMTTSDLLDAKIGPHVHFEAIAPNGRTIIENSHVLLRWYQ